MSEDAAEEMEIPDVAEVVYEPPMEMTGDGVQKRQKKKMPQVPRKAWKTKTHEGCGCCKGIESPIMSLTAEVPEASINAVSGSSWLRVDPVTGWRRVTSVMDSGASECCAPPELAPEVPVTESEGSRRGQKYTAAAAGGKALENLGEKNLDMFTDEGQGTNGTWQMVDVVRPLNSVRQICKQGNRVLFGLNGGVIQNIETGREIAFGVEGDVYTMDLWLPPVHEVNGGSVGSASGFAGPGWKS